MKNNSDFQGIYQKTRFLHKHLIVGIYMDFLRFCFPFFCTHWLMGYIKGKPLSLRYSLRLPLSCRQGGFVSSLPIGLAPTSTRSKSSISFCRTGFFSIIRWRILSASTKWWAVLIICFPVSGRQSSRLCLYGRLSAPAWRSFL